MARDSVDTESAEQWKSTKLPNLLQEFCTDNICNDDETSLFCHVKPDGSLSYRHATLSDSQKEMDRVNIFCCSNRS
jgi:hypothetical protein